MKIIFTYNQFLESIQVIDGKKFWGTIGAGILPYCVKTKKYLVLLRSDEVLEPLTWGLIGGKLDIKCLKNGKYE